MERCDNMRNIFKKSYLFLILFLIIIFKSNLFNLLGNLNSLFVEKNINKIDNNILIAENKTLKKELNDLSKSIDMKEVYNYKYTIAKVSLRDIYEFYDTFTINKGKESGIKKGDAVVCNEGLLGVVKKVGKNYSKVNLISNKDENISIKIKDSYGVLDNYNYVDNIFEINKITNLENINNDDNVYTSGLGLLPPNIYIGKIKSVKNNLGIESILTMEVNYDINNINYVAVIIGDNK